MSRLPRWLAASLLSLACVAAHAGGPLGTCSGLPVKYPGAGTVTLNYDLGALNATHTKAQADALVTSAVSLWTNVGTSTVTLARGADLSANMTSANFAASWSALSDGLNPVMYDADGLIIDALFGGGARNSVLGVAGSGYYIYPDRCEYAEGRAVINGYLNISDTTMQVTIAHEVGHLIGMDHTQLDASQGLSSSNYPLMYPIAYRNSASLHADDAAAVSAIYPGATLGTAYGEISGTFTQVSGTPIRGANIWAQGVPGVFSSVSDYLEQGTGYFRLLLPPGTYTLRAEAIQTEFTGGSSVGPYSENLSGLSFASPLYVGGVAMAPVTLGGGTPTQITVTAGCAATVAFRINGTGTVGGTCSTGTKSAITSPAAGSVLAGASVTFNWDAGSGVTERYLAVGTALGASDIYGAYQGAAMSRTVSGLPTNGSTVYVRLQSWVNGGWQVNDYTYTAATVVTGTKSAITTPGPGATLTSDNEIFMWTAGSGVSERYLTVGTSLGGSQIYAGYQGAGLSLSVPGLPTNGSTVYVTLLSWIGSGWQANDYTYTAASLVAAAKSEVTSPAPGSVLGSSSVTFAWTAGSGVTERYFAVGTSLGASNLYGGYEGAAASQTVNGLPTNGSTVYVRLMSWIGGGWQLSDYVYTGGSAGASMESVVNTPAPGSVLGSSTETFGWSAGNGVAERYLMVGTTLGGSQIYAAYQGALLSRSISNLPTNGSTVYVRLLSWINGGWAVSDATFTAASGGGPANSTITSPVSGSTLGSSSVTFNWTAGSGVLERYLMVGTTPGGLQVYAAYQGALLSRNVSGLPTNGSTVYVRLLSWIGSDWVVSDSSYIAVTQ